MIRKPDWLKVPNTRNQTHDQVFSLIKHLSLHTVCEEANCPNRGECFSSGTATFLLMGNRCTRQCTFCNVTKEAPEKLDPDEPKHIAEAVETLNLHYVVLTSVTRDDLPDGGAGVFAESIREIHKRKPDLPVEVLIPDLQGNTEALKVVLDANPAVLNHNIETVPSLYSSVRPIANYERSLQVLENAKKMHPTIFTKSGMMLGLGETEIEILSVLKDLRKVACDLMVIGQYLPPSQRHRPLTRYVSPVEFEYYKQKALEYGFKEVIASPLARSSYKAIKMLSN
jgi:lipoic acid synthetase